MKRPNIMLLVAEDTGRHQGCYGETIARTPTIDRLAEEGVRYTNAFATAPVCAPSRCSIVSGKYAFSLGAHHMRSRLTSPPRMLTHELRDAGYYVNWSNKTDFNFEPPESFSEDRHEWFDDLASGKLKGRPWLLYHNFYITHESFMWKEKWMNAHSAESEKTTTRPEDVTVPAYLPDSPEVRADIARYMDNLAEQDRQVARALDALEKSGEADNTIVIYISDHGRGLPREKRWCYEAGLHMPLIIRWPGKIEPGTVDEQLVGWVDMAPTILSMLGLPIPSDYQGRVFWGEGVTTAPREYCFAGRDRMGEAFDRVRVVRDGRYLYVRNFFPELPYAQRNRFMENQATTQVLRELNAEGRLQGSDAVWMQPHKPVEELYDCEADPDCVVNLAADPSQADRLSKMRTVLEDFLKEVDDKAVHSERALIEQGLVEDHLENYRKNIAPLPEKHRLGDHRVTVLEMPE